MPQHPVPVFGAWESKAQSYTLIFNHVRAEKGSKKIINPNDPEFFSALQEQQGRPLPDDEVRDATPENLTTQEAAALPSFRPQPVSKRVNKRTNHGNLDSIPRPLNAGISDIGNDAGILSQNNDKADEQPDSFSSSSSTESARSDGIKSSGGRRHRRSAQTDDNQLAVERPEADRGMKENKRYSQSPSHPTAYQGRLGNRARSPWSQRTRDEPQAVLPPFGAWDDKNPASGEEYTAIFKNLRDEKKAGIGARASPLHTETPGRKTQEVQRKKTWSWFQCGCASSHDVDDMALRSI